MDWSISLSQSKWMYWILSIESSYWSLCWEFWTMDSIVWKSVNAIVAGAAETNEDWRIFNRNFMRMKPNGWTRKPCLIVVSLNLHWQLLSVQVLWPRMLGPTPILWAAGCAKRTVVCLSSGESNWTWCCDVYYSGKNTHPYRLAGARGIRLTDSTEYKQEGTENEPNSSEK